MLNIKAIEERARAYKERLGGMIFVFPVDEENPYSLYAFASFKGTDCWVYPEAAPMEDAAGHVLATLELLNESGFPSTYEKDVRFISCEAQMNGPSLAVRRLKKAERKEPFFEDGVDGGANPDDLEGYLFSARGVIKVGYLQMMDEKNPKGKQFMEGYYQLLASRRYGKTAAAIRQEVRRMSKDEARKWIENTYTKYVQDDREILDMLQRPVII